MDELIGLFIEDEAANVDIYTRLFALEGLKLDCLDKLPLTVDSYYDIILEKNVDFLIIDFHLEKQVTYKGIDVLREIRKHDSTIYAVLLTNYELDDFADQFGDYDYELQKSEITSRYKDVAEKIKRACGLRKENLMYMIQEVGGLQTDKAKEIKSSQLFGIEYDREIYALACANMLIHKDGKTNLEQMDARTETSGKWIAKQNVTKVLMNPPYENKYGCMKIVENVLDNVPAHTMCGFILPDKKLEKASKAQMKRILKHHRLRKVIKLPEDVFFNVGVTTSIFIFETGIPQDKNEFFACWMESDGLATVKNKGRHDVYNKWSTIEDKWVDIVMKQSGDDTCQWVNPEEHLSYQMPQKPFEIFEEDFRKTAMDYIMFQKGIDTKDFGEKLLERAMYSSCVSADDDVVTVTMQKGDDSDGKD